MHPRWSGGLTRRSVGLGCSEPQSNDEVGCRDPSHRTVFDSCSLWKHWSNNADVKKYNDVLCVMPQPQWVDEDWSVSNDRFGSKVNDEQH